MGVSLKFIFEIERRDFTQAKIAAIIKLILKQYPTDMTNQQISNAVNETYANGKGFGAELRAKFPYSELSRIVLSAYTADNEEVVYETETSPSAFKKPSAITKDKCWICIIVDTRSMSPDYNSNALLDLINDVINVYASIKPLWGRGGYDSVFGSFTTDWSKYVTPFIFFTPQDIKRIGERKFNLLNVYRKFVLPDGGIFIQIWPGVHEDRPKNNGFSEEDVAHLLGYQTLGR